MGAPGGVCAHPAALAAEASARLTAASCGHRRRAAPRSIGRLADPGERHRARKPQVGTSSASLARPPSCHAICAPRTFHGTFSGNGMFVLLGTPPTPRTPPRGNVQCNPIYPPFPFPGQVPTVGGHGQRRGRLRRATPVKSNNLSTGERRIDFASFHGFTNTG